MSGKLQPPLLTPAQATTLLDQVVYEQVLECIDLDALCQLEQSLTLAVAELDGIPDEQIGDVATAMLDRALLRLPGDVRRYLRAADWPLTGGCPLCEEEEREDPPARSAATGGSGPRHATRLKS